MTPLIFDGAFGTYYASMERGAHAYEYANICDAETVLLIHKRYINAGVGAIKTNTFAANSVSLGDKRDDVLEAGYKLACEAVRGSDVRVFADIGYITPCGDDDPDEYAAIAEKFLSLGARNFLFETCESFLPLLPAIRRVRKAGAFAIVSFAVSEDGITRSGLYYKTLIEETLKYADMAGLNCICGPAHLYELVSELDCELSHLSVMPNSGYPSRVGGRTVFRDNEDYYAEKLLRIASLGVGAVGGCCGTTPAHIKKAAVLINSPDFRVEPPVRATMDGSKAKAVESRLKAMLESGKKVIAVELDPPMDADIEPLERSAVALKTAGCDVVTVADSPLARTRADSFMCSVYLHEKTGVEVIPHMSCRDRNHIGVKAALLGANISGIDDVLVISGDPVNATERGEGNGRGVFSYNSYSLISLINGLNAEVFKKRPYTVCAALNINAVNFDSELSRAKRKIENGACVFFSQPVFSDESIANLKKARETLPCRLFAGILPVVSQRNAMFLNNEVPGISVPQEIIDSFEGKSREEACEISVKCALRLIDRVYDFCDGIHIMIPLKRTDIVCELIKSIRSRKGGNLL